MEIKTGMRVKIIKSDKTKKSYGVTPDMRRMVGELIRQEVYLHYQ